MGAVGQGPTAALCQASRTQLERPPLVPASCSDLEYSCFECSVTRWLRHSGDPRASPGPASLLGSRDKGPTQGSVPQSSEATSCGSATQGLRRRRRGRRWPEVASGLVQGVQFRLSLQRASRGQAGERKRGALGRRRGCNRSGEASLSCGSKPGQPLLPHSRA